MYDNILGKIFIIVYDRLMENRMMGKMDSIIKNMLEITNDGEFSKLKQGISKEKFKYMVTLDMGCGNTSSAVFRIADGNGSLSIWEYKEQGTDGNIEKIQNISIPTIFGFDVNKPVIGPEAMIFGGAVENFKTIPSDNNLDNIIHDKVGSVIKVPLRTIWEQYFNLVLDATINKVKNKFPDINKENIIFVVAHPSDDSWKAYLDSYKNLICNGTGLGKEQIITFSEAKAAMQYVKIEKKLEINWEKGVIVIDLGASTIDIAYLAYGQKQKEYSITMAGKEVDRLLGHKILSYFYPGELETVKPNELPDDQFFEAHKRDLRLRKREFSYLMRSFKENVCSGIPQTFTKNGKSIMVDNQLIQEILSTQSFEFTCYNPAIANYMNGAVGKQVVNGTWYSHLNNLVEYVLTKIGKYADKIIVTGGTANLVGIKDCIARAIITKWGNNWGGKMIILDRSADYERTVPYGSASYLSNVIKNIPTISGFPGILETILTEEVTEKVAPAIRDAVAPLVERSMQNVVNNWADLPKKDNRSSINALINDLNRININQNTIDNAIDAAIGNVNANINIAQLGKTKNVIEDFLRNLSIGQVYTRPIGNIKIQCHMTTATIRQVVQVCVGQLSMGECITGVINRIRYLFTNDDKPLSPKTRKNIKDNFQERFLDQNTISDELLKVIDNEFPATFKDNEGFGLPESIIEGLEMDINQAMFM